MNEPVGVAQLRQNLSVYLRRIERGERFVVTDRNREVAQIGPLPRNARDELIANGRLIPAAEPDGWRAVEPVPLSGDRDGLSQALRHVRGD
jgi:antitoxin (DNA-binding transcriptional repressor) of toxin-antitoxin stability system